MHDISFDGSFEGLLNIVYLRYYEKIEPLSIRSFDGTSAMQLGLDFDTIKIIDNPIQKITAETDYDKADRVYTALRKKTAEGAENAYRAWLSPTNIYMDIYQYIMLCFKEGAHAENFKTLDYVLAVHKAVKYVGTEVNKLVGFCRFAETTSGVYYCDISPVNNVLPLLVEHFCSRFHEQAFVLHDVGRGIAAIYDTNECLFQEVGKHAKFEVDDSENQWQELWSAFHKTLANENRVNTKLQRQMMPLRYRKHVTEYKHLEEIRKLKHENLIAASKQNLLLSQQNEETISPRLLPGSD